MLRSSVLLPLPDGPMKTATSPAGTDREMPSRIRLEPWYFTNFSIWIMRSFYILPAVFNCFGFDSSATHPAAEPDLQFSVRYHAAVRNQSLPSEASSAVSAERA